MGIAGLGTYSSTSFYYKMTSQGNNTNVNDKFDLGLVPGQSNNQDETADTVGKPARTSVIVPYTRCITTTIQTEEMYASQSENGEMVYSYKASEQSFNIYINSDGQNKTYSIEGIDKDGQPFIKEFDPYDVDPEYADFPEFAALCLYIQNTDETADMLANDYFATDDILEKCNYLEKLQGFGTDTIFEKAQSMLDLANKLVNTLQQITDMRSELDSFFAPFFTKYLVEDVDLDDYPDIAGKISEELSSEKVSETTEPEERVTPLGFGFANAGMMGYGMSAALVEKPGCDDTIIRVKLATGSGDEVIDVNLSNFDPRNATPVEMFAYCQYKDAIGEGVNNKWGSWNALKGIALTENGADFGSLDNIMNKKMNWNHALAKSQTSYMDPKTNEIILSPSDLLKLLEDANTLTTQEPTEEKDWREMSDEEWDKLLEGIDKYIDAFKERLRQMKEMQEDATQKTALEADSEYSSYEYISVVDRIGQSEKGAVETKEPLKLIAMDINGIRCINDDTHEVEWEIKFNSEAEYQKAAKLMKWLGHNMNNFMAATDEKQWSDFLSGKLSEGAFKNTLMAQEA